MLRRASSRCTRSVSAQSGSLTSRALTRSPASAQQVIDHVNHEKRIAVGPCVNYRCERAELARTVAGQASGEVITDIFFAERLQAQFLAITMQFELLLHRAQRMVAGEYLNRPIRPNDQYSRRLAAPRYCGKSDRALRPITPMQIFE